MDDEETTSGEKLIPRLHDKWSLLVLALDYVTAVASVTVGTLEIATKMAAQHAVQKNTDHEFSEMIGE